MKRKFFAFIALITATFSLSSCLSSDDTTVEYTYDTAITSFSLGNLDRYAKYLYRALPCHLLWCQVCRHQPHPHDMLLCFCRIAVAVLTEINFSETERTFNISTKE